LKGATLIAQHLKEFVTLVFLGVVSSVEITAGRIRASIRRRLSASLLDFVEVYPDRNEVQRVRDLEAAWSADL